MADRNIVLHHGGFWRGNTYINRIEEYVHVSSGGMTYPRLFDEAIGIVGDDPNLYKYAISTLMLSADDKMIRFRIKNDSDLDHANSVLPFLRLYVETFDKAAPTQAQYRFTLPAHNSFVGLLHSQNVCPQSHAHDNAINRRTEAEIVHRVEIFFYADDTVGVEEDNVTLDHDEERVNDETSVRSNDDNFSADERCRMYDQGNDETYYDDDGEEVHADEEADDLDGCCRIHRTPDPPSVSRCESNDVQDDAFERTIASKIIGAYFAPDLLDEGKVLKTKEMQMKLQREFGVRMDYTRALAGRNHAIRMIYGDSDKSFQLLPSYLYMLEQSNPGSVVELQTDVVGQFENISIASENGAYKRLLDADPIRWARCKSPVRRYEFMTSNYAECLNGRLRWVRRLPVCTLLECVRTLIGCWFYERHKNALGRSHPLTQYVIGEVAKSIEQGKTMTIQPISAMKFEVTSGMKHYTVDLSVRKCSCLEFDLNLIPCPHAAAAISKANQHPYAYVNNYYSTENLGKMVVSAPPNPRQANRPRMSRIRSASQSSSGGRRVRARCARYGQSGHNRATCTEFIPISEGSQVGSNEFAASNTIRARRPHRCGICRGSGHTRTTCPNRGP
ncbi:hypothetical protein C2S52_015881 [Perilla frutescens var. hirtella]|nr:hypothetical protein C2S52_015881 [Perilla frutescens var. hirtella]